MTSREVTSRRKVFPTSTYLFVHPTSRRRSCVLGRPFGGFHCGRSRYHFTAKRRTTWTRTPITRDRIRMMKKSSRIARGGGRAPSPGPRPLRHGAGRGPDHHHPAQGHAARRRDGERHHVRGSHHV